MTEEKTNFMNRAKFTKLIEEQVLSKKLGYIDAVVEACDITNIDPEDVKNQGKMSFFLNKYSVQQSQNVV